MADLAVVQGPSRMGDAVVINGSRSILTGSPSPGSFAGRRYRPGRHFHVPQLTPRNRGNPAPHCSSDNGIVSSPVTQTPEATGSNDCPAGPSRATVERKRASLAPQGTAANGANHCVGPVSTGRAHRSHPRCHMLDCTKVPYSSASAALAALPKVRQRQLRRGGRAVRGIHHCPCCGCWHHTSQRGMRIRSKSKVG